MKRLVYIWLVAWVLWGCQKEEAYFDVLVPADGLTFSPVEGGAVMHYRVQYPGTLPGRVWEGYDPDR